MKNENSSLTISIIALIVSIIALIISLLIVFNCPCCLHRNAAPAVEPQPQEQAVVAEPVAQEPEQQPVEDQEEQGKVPTPTGQVKKKPATAPFIDLGLPSGTKWRTLNEDGFLTYDDAVATFGKKLPSQKQFTELYDKCKWEELKGGGYKVTGPNGNSIIFPLTGYINCTGEFRGANELGDYWTSTTNGTDEAYRVAMNSKGVKIVLHTRCYQRAIRLVEK